MKTIISSTTLVRQIGDCLAKVKYKGDRFVITKNDEPVAELLPADGNFHGRWGDIAEAVSSLPFDDQFADDLDIVNNSDSLASNPWD